MARQGYLSLYADPRTREIFDKFLDIKGISKTAALSDMMNMYMLCTDESLYNELYKKSMGVEKIQQEVLDMKSEAMKNDHIIMKLNMATNANGDEMTGQEVLQAYMKNLQGNGLGYTCFSTQSLHHGMAPKKVAFYNECAKKGERVRILFAIAGKNEIAYSADVQEIISNRDPIPCPCNAASEPEEFLGEQNRIWLKINNLKEENDIKASKLYFRTTGSNLKDVISKSQFHFGYVYQDDNM